MQFPLTAHSCSCPAPPPNLHPKTLATSAHAVAPIGIREIVALGGPNAKDHPDLFRLLEKSRCSNRPKPDSIDAAKAIAPLEECKRGVETVREEHDGGKRRVSAGGIAESSARRSGSGAQELPGRGEEQEWATGGEEESELARERCPW